MWKRSQEFINWPFLLRCKTSIMSVMGLYECCVSSMCCAYFELELFDLMEWMCSLYLVWKFLPVCPTYFFGHPPHFSWYMHPTRIKYNYITYISWESHRYYTGSVVSQFVSYYPLYYTYNGKISFYFKMSCTVILNR
jgi:hypothetical protein